MRSAKPTARAPALRPALAVAAALLGAVARAQTQAPSPAAGPSLAPLVLGLVLVLALIPAAAWLLRRAGLAQPAQTAGLRVVSQLPLGPRDRLVIIEAGDRRWLLGVSASGIRRLGTLPPGTGADAPPADGPGHTFADIFRRLGSPR
jgi:flagellar protein FliO/FliZ